MNTKLIMDNVVTVLRFPGEQIGSVNIGESHALDDG